MIYRINSDCQVIEKYLSVKQCSKELGFTRQSLSRAISNLKKGSGPLFFKESYWVSAKSEDELPDYIEKIKGYSLKREEGYCSYCKKIIPLPKKLTFGDDHWGWNSLERTSKQNIGLERINEKGDTVRGYYVCKSRHNESSLLWRKKKIPSCRW